MTGLRVGALGFAWALSVTACTSSATVERPAVDEPSPEPDPLSDPEPEPVRTEGPALALAPQHFEEAALALRILDVPHEATAWERGGALTQYVPLEQDYMLSVVVRVGEGETLDHVREFRPSLEFEPIVETQLCDRPAQLLIARSPAQHITCIEFADGTPSRPGYDPAQTHVFVGFEHEGLGATAEWSVPSAYRPLYRSLEDEFFAKLGCPS